MQFERNEKHLILITTNYIEPPKYNYVVMRGCGKEHDEKGDSFYYWEKVFSEKKL